MSIIKKIKEFKIENIYIVLALILGLAMAVFNPPFAGVPDEHAHYWKAWSIADGYWRCTGKDAIPKTAAELPSKIMPVAYDGIKEKKIVVAKLRQEFGIKETGETTIIGGAVCPSAPFGYIPQAIGLRLGKAIGLPPLADFYLARILTLLASIALIFYAIRFAPFGKIIFFIIGLLPLTVRQLASLSYDSLQISFALLFFAYVLKMAVEKDIRLKIKDILLLLFLSFFGLSIKLGYVVMAGLILIIPRSKFSSKKKYYAFISLFLLANIGCYFLLRNTFREMFLPEWLNPAEQLQYVIFAPFHFLNVIFETIFQSGLTNYIGGIMYWPGWGGNATHWLQLFIFIGIIIFIRSEEEKSPLTKWQRLILFLVFFSNFILIYLGLYLGWTKLGAEKVSGVQGRYMIGLLPFLIFAFYRIRPGIQINKLRENKNIALIVFFAVVFIFVFQTTYQLYYNKALPEPSTYEKFLNEKQK